jgi:hypothetical protein
MDYQTGNFNLNLDFVYASGKTKVIDPATSEVVVIIQHDEQYGDSVEMTDNTLLGQLLLAALKGAA